MNDSMTLGTRDSHSLLFSGSLNLPRRKEIRLAVEAQGIPIVVGGSC
jgi:hypothetical protein